MFNNQRYLSKGVDSRVSKFVQILIWEMIDLMSVEKDYLQIFSLNFMMIWALTQLLCSIMFGQRIFLTIICLNGDIIKETAAQKVK